MTAYESFSLGVLFLPALAASAPAQVARDAKDLYPNYDIRDVEAVTDGKILATIRARSTNGPSSRALTQTFSAMSAANTALATRVPMLQLEMNARGNAPEAIGTKSADNFSHRNRRARMRKGRGSFYTSRRRFLA